MGRKYAEMLSVIIPTKNEQENIQELISKLWLIGAEEIIVVDDSTDNTKEKALESGAMVINGKGSLGASVIEGFKHVTNEWVLVMDGDLSHSPDYIQEMLNQTKDYDLIIGSRYAGGIFNQSSFRRLISKVGTYLTESKVKDPLSGFFMIRKDKIPQNLSCNGFKILLEILYRTDLRIKEIPIVFNDRKNGKSKFNLKEGIKFLIQVGKHNRFLKYLSVGATGVIINLGLLYILTELGVYYILSGVIGFMVSFITNYQLNKRWTFR